MNTKNKTTAKRKSGCQNAQKVADFLNQEARHYPTARELLKARLKVRKIKYAAQGGFDL